MSSYATVLNYPEAWWPDMHQPPGFNREAVERYQKQIDEITGTRDGKPLIKLDWGPRVFKWRPHPIHETGEGYTFPVFLALWDNYGREVAAPRWVLMERQEPDQYMDGWEETRYAVFDNQQYDVKGPAPVDGYYIPLWRHVIHKPFKACCPIDTDCWGQYLEPNRDLLDRIAKCAFKSRNDSDVQPFTPSRFFSAPKAQLEAKDKMQKQRAQQIAVLDQVFIDAERRRKKNTVYSHV